MSDIRKRLLGCRGTNFTASSTRVQARRVMSLQRPVPAFSDRNASGLDPQGVAVLTDGMSCPALVRVAQKDSLLGSKQGDPWVPGTSQGPMGFRGKGVVIWSPAPQEISETEARANYVQSTGVAVLPGGALLPAPSGPHQQGTPPSEFLGSKQGPMGSWQHGGTPLDSSTRVT